MHKSLIFTEAGITIRALQGFTTKTRTLREKRKSRKGQKKKEKRTRIRAHLKARARRAADITVIREVQASKCSALTTIHFFVDLNHAVRSFYEHNVIPA